ncbi:serine/threonine-protein kinase [Yinghuangia seranimata]|uniref:serine/threonine-protein kinase n=1 Tax=Yinghuangia seranimata TaxID=408067 RepID=UPI00248AE929|nr:serine/threonine-protein kinase [Yinghuangia seranimata]MDI2125651.1 serine/threonine-protein kinase [Yinghuangia seranimata]
MLAGRYELVRFVGRGGMGEVWEGRDRLIERRVAVKLLPHATGDASGAALFFREARTAGALHHPGVVTVYDLGQDDADGALYLVMEFVDGRDLAAVLREQGPPAVATAADWAAQAALALGRAHTAGIVHRDLKPANLMLTAEGQVKILDFGIARFVESTNHSSKVMGTLAYMPPERFDEQPGDARSDLYALGCVLHELLTGKVPFQATGAVSMMNAHLRKAPTRPGEHRAGIPGELDDLVLELLAKEPGDRPAPAEEVHRRLRAVVDGLAPLAPSSASSLSPAQASSPSRPAAPPAAPPAVTTVVAAPVVDPDAVPLDAAVTIGPDPGPAAGGLAGGDTSRPARRRFLWLAVAGAATVAAGGVTAALTLTDGPDDPRKPQQATPGNQAASQPTGPGDEADSPSPAAQRSAPGKPWTYLTDGRVGSSPAVVNGVVYIGGGDHKVYALDAITGAKKWEYTTGLGVGASPVVANGVVYVGSSDANVYALDAVTGAEKWVHAAGAEVDASPALAGGVLFVACRTGNVYALDPATGTRKWTSATGHGEIDSRLLVRDGRVYTTSTDGNVYALDATTGTKKWTYTIGPKLFSSPALAGGVLYVGGGADKNVHALDAATGNRKWTYTAGDDVNASPVVVDGVVYIGSQDKNLYALDAATGTKKWTFASEGYVWNAVAVADGVVYVFSSDKNLYALDAATGVKKRTYATNGYSASDPVVAGGLVYIGSSDNHLYAFDIVG